MAKFPRRGMGVISGAVPFAAAAAHQKLIFAVPLETDFSR
jgi:hypothetical protein